MVRLGPRRHAGDHAALVEDGEDEADETAVQLLVHGLRMEVHRGRHDCQVRVAVVPADDAGVQAKLLGKALCLPCSGCQLFWTDLNPVAGSYSLLSRVQGDAPYANLHAFAAAHINHVAQQESHDLFCF